MPDTFEPCTNVGWNTTHLAAATVVRHLLGNTIDGTTDDADTPQYLGLVAAGNTNPTARVEYALRADELLSEPQVRQIMEYYLAVRMRRFGRAFQPSEPSSSRPPDRPIARSAPVGQGPVVAGVGQASSSQITPSRMGSIRPMGRSLGRPGRP